MMIGEDLFYQQMNRELERIEQKLNREGELGWLALQRLKISLNLILNQLKQLDPKVGQSHDVPDAEQMRRNLYYFKAQMLLQQIEEKRAAK